MGDLGGGNGYGLNSPHALREDFTFHMRLKYSAAQIDPTISKSSGSGGTAHNEMQFTVILQQHITYPAWFDIVT